LKEFSSPELATDLKIQTSSLNRFSDVLSATRNLIAHAKANYTLTGDECPSDQYEAFAVSAKLAAEQAIVSMTATASVHACEAGGMWRHETIYRK
jgi:hypothetical protein